MKKSARFSIVALSLALYSSQAFAGLFDGIHWPEIKIPPVTEWKVGGTAGKLWEDNKAALAASAIGGAAFGPLGAILGFIEGAKTDKAKKAVLEAQKAMEEIQGELQQGSARFPQQAENIRDTYLTAGKFFDDRDSPDAAWSELNSSYIAAGRCLFRAQSTGEADDCYFAFSDEATEIQKKYRS